MTRRMLDFLQRAARAENGKGIPVKPYDIRIASKACSDGYGWMITAPLKVFVLDERGREAVKACEAY